jgi:hypothetical protein
MASPSENKKSILLPPCVYESMNKILTNLVYHIFLIEILLSF